jgi:protein gp37
MGEKTNITWTHHTFNPWRGCTKVSPGCTHCYAEDLSRINPAVLGQWGPQGQRPIKAERQWDEPLKWDRLARRLNERRRVFCASLADVFEDRPELVAPRGRLFRLIRVTTALDWLILTKRPENFGHLLPPDWRDGYPNVWLGVSIENNDYIHRADLLRAVPAAVRFVSYEPALGPLDRLDLSRLDWLIFGGEFGPRFRPMDLQWARDIQQRCRAAGVRFFFKQIAARQEGQQADALGEVVQEYPAARRLSLSLLS